jgi:hypothetical protein
LAHTTVVLSRFSRAWVHSLHRVQAAAVGLKGDDRPFRGGDRCADRDRYPLPDRSGSAHVAEDRVPRCGCRLRG